MGSPGRGTSPISSRGDDVLDKDLGQNHCGKDYSHRRSDRYSSRSSDGHSTSHIEYRGREKHLDEEDRRRDLRKESEHGRSRGYSENTDRYSRDRYGSSKYRSKDKERELFLSDERKFRDKDVSSDSVGFGSRHSYATSEDKERDRYTRDKDVRDDKRGGHMSYRDRKSHRNDSTERDYRSRDSYKNDHKEPSGHKDMKKYDDLDTNKDKNQYNRAGEVQKENKLVLGSVNQESLAKRPKLFSGNLDADHINEREKQVEEDDEKASAKEVHADHSVAANDLNSAKVAALKAAELVNRNLVGVGVMSTEQKKKLLWGNKKSTTSEVSTARRWDSALFDDHERQEKFNKLMSLRLPWCLWPIVGCEGRGEGRGELQHPQWRWSCTSREAEGSSDGFREAVHCWTPTKGWPNCWTWPLSVCSNLISTFRTMYYGIFVLKYENYGSPCFELCTE